MTRLLSAVKTDIVFQFKQGIYIVYIFISIMYMIILSFLPQDLLGIALPIVVYSDPSVIGLFFIGGIILLEKIQGVIVVVITTPLRTSEYLLAKVISLTMISLLAGIAITLLTREDAVNWGLLVMSVIGSSSFFTLCGVYLSATAKNVNEYLVRVVPVMLLVVLPCFSLIEFPGHEFFQIIPSVAGLKLLLGAYHSIPPLEAFLLLLDLFIADFLLFRITLKHFEKHVVYGGANPC